MRQLPLADELPYRFYPPRLNWFCLALANLSVRRMLRKEQRVESIDVAGLEHIAPLLERGDGVLLAPNHPDHADPHVIFDLSRRLNRPFYYMAAFQIFEGNKRWFLPRIGVFPVDREGTDLTSFKTGVNVLAEGKNPLVIFPEGEIYRLAERLTPLREGAVAVAATAAKRLAGQGKTVWIVPVAIKYRFLDGHDPVPALEGLMADLERQFTWWPRRHQGLTERIYHYAEGMLGLKEYEYRGATGTGPLRERIGGLANSILSGAETRRLAGKTRGETVPERVKELRRACLDALADAKTTPDEANVLRRDLHDLFVAVQLFSYPGDYVRESPTLERVAETLAKFEEDVLDIDISCPRGPRRAIARVGEPIDVRARLALAARPRAAVPALTNELESRLQALLDTIGPGRLLEPAEMAKAAPSPAGA